MVKHTMTCTVPGTGRAMSIPAEYGRVATWVMFGSLTAGYYHARAAGHENRPGGPPTVGWRNGRVIHW